jgi:hypothetical protein
VKSTGKKKLRAIKYACMLFTEKEAELVSLLPIRPFDAGKAAEGDFEYFLRFIDVALAYFSDRMETSVQIQ